MKNSTTIFRKDILFWAALCLAAFLPFLGAAPLFDWDEINFAESAREMMTSGNYFQVMIDFEPFWEKPPLFFWMQVISMKIFGINEFAARFPNAIIGLVSIIGIYQTGFKLKNRNFGWIAAAFFFSGILPFSYFKSGIIDPTFNFFIFMSLISVFRFEINEESRITLPITGGIWAGLATLTKGPVAILVILLVYFLYKVIWSRKHIPWKGILGYAASSLVIVLAWFGSIVLLTEDGAETVRKFIVYQFELASQDVATHGQPFYYHFIVFIVGCFPISVFAFRGMLLKPEKEKDLMLKRFMLIWFWVVMILFSIVRTKIIHYSSLLYYPGTFLAALAFWEMIRTDNKLKWDQYIIYAIGFLSFGIAPALINVLVNNRKYFAENVSDPYAAGSLMADVQWNGYEYLAGLLFGLMIIVAFILLMKKMYKPFLYVHVGGIILFVNLMYLTVLPKVAKHTQGAVVDFYKAHSNEKAFFMTSYKSYAQYFYATTDPVSYPEEKHHDKGDWLARGEVSYPVYLVAKKGDDTEEFEKVWFPNFEKLMERNGFVFYVRWPEEAGGEDD